MAPTTSETTPPRTSVPTSSPHTPIPFFFFLALSLPTPPDPSLRSQSDSSPSTSNRGSPRWLGQVSKGQSLLSHSRNMSVFVPRCASSSHGVFKATWLRTDTKYTCVSARVGPCGSECAHVCVWKRETECRGCPGVVRDWGSPKHTGVRSRLHPSTCALGVRGSRGRALHVRRYHRGASIPLLALHTCRPRGSPTHTGSRR